MKGNHFNSMLNPNHCRIALYPEHHSLIKCYSLLSVISGAQFLCTSVLETMQCNKLWNLDFTVDDISKYSWMETSRCII